MYVYTHSYVYFEDGIMPANRLKKKVMPLGAYSYVLENGLELILPNTIELEIGQKVQMTAPIEAGKYHNPEYANLIGLLNTYLVNYGAYYVLYIPNTTESALADIVKQLKMFAHKYLKLELDIYYDAGNSSIDVSDLIYNLKANTDFNIGIIPEQVLMGDMKTVVSFIAQLVPLFREMNRGYMIRLISENYFTAVLHILMRLGIIPTRIEQQELMISRSDYRVLLDMITDKFVPLYKPVELKIVSKTGIGIRNFVKVENAIAVDGVARESFEVVKT